MCLAGEIRHMDNCTPMKLMISEILEATPKEAKEATPNTMPGTVQERLTRKTPALMDLMICHGPMMDRFHC